MAGDIITSTKICIIKIAFQLVSFYFRCDHSICRACSGALARNRSKSSAGIVLVNVVSWFTKHFMGVRLQCQHKNRLRARERAGESYELNF